MKAILIVLILVIGAYTQVQPIWSQSNRVQTRNVVLVPNHVSVTQIWEWNTTYNTTWTSNPSVALSIYDLRITTNNGQIGFLSYISFFNSAVYFTHKIQVYSPTQVWFMRARYIAFDGGFVQLSDITMTFKHFKDSVTGNDKLNSVATSPGGYRTETKNTQMAAVNTNNNVSVTIFTTGFRGTINNTHFQVNVTGKIQTTGLISAVIDVGPDTVLKQLAIYVLVVDHTKLYNSCWTFVQTAITAARNGTQYSFFTYSEVSYDDNYISGLRCLSIINNIQYNFTISGFNFTTFSNSYYNDVSHFNVWIRYCPSPYIYFNQVDFLCYIFCPNGTYMIATDSICKACDYTCFTCSTGTTCDICGLNRQKDVNGDCICKDYYYEDIYQTCVPCHYSCKTCSYPGQFVDCDSCDIGVNRTLDTSTSTCNCTPGFQDVGYTQCVQKCGDGIINILPCDDNNVLNDDGCSSTCYQQPYFDCIGQPSKCYYVGNITIEVVRIEKDPGSNKASFHLKISPYVPLFESLTLDNIVTNLSNARQTTLTSSGQLLIYTIQYYDNLEDQNMVIGIKPSLDPNNPFSQFYPVNVTIKAQASNGLALNAYSAYDYRQAKQLGIDAMIIGYVFMAFAILFCYGDWKELGLQLFFMLQLSFMSFVALPYLHPYNQNGCQVNNVMGWNSIVPQQIPPYHYAPVLEHMKYSVAFQNNFNIMVIFPALALVLYGVYRIVLYLHEKDRIEGQQFLEFDDTLKGKILNHFRFDFFVYWMLVNMQQILMGTVIQGKSIQNGGIYVYIVLLLAGIIFCIVGLFIRPQSLGAYRKKLFHKSYGDKTFLVVLVSTLLMDLFLLLTVMVQRFIFYAMLVFPVIVIVYLIARRPFKLMGNNVRLVIIQACLLTVFILQVVTMHTQYSVHKLFIIGILVLMGIAVLVTLIMWVYDLIKKICRWRKNQYEDESSNNQSVKEQQSINEKVREAGHALVHGGTPSNTKSRLPTYEMTRFNNDRSPRHAPVQRLKKPIQNTPAKKSANLKEANEEKVKDNSKIRPKNQKNEPYDTNVQNQSMTKDKSQLTTKDKYNRQRNREVSIPARQDTIQKMGNSTARRRTNVNAYQQILEQTSIHKKN